MLDFFNSFYHGICNVEIGAGVIKIKEPFGDAALNHMASHVDILSLVVGDMVRCHQCCALVGHVYGGKCEHLYELHNKVIQGQNVLACVRHITMFNLSGGQ